MTIPLGDRSPGRSSEDVVVCGHTHLQFDREVDGIRVVNAGSVGAPYEAEPAAYWALLRDDVELRRTDYDVEAAVAAIAATGYPNASEALGFLRADPARPERIARLIEQNATRRRVPKTPAETPAARRKSSG